MVYDPTDIPVRGEFAQIETRCTEPRRAIVATLDGRKDLPSLLMFAHPDSEPVSGVANWTHDPFAGDDDDGRIYGWGVADDLAGCAAAVLAMEELARARHFMGRAVFASTPSKRHARGVAAILHQGISADGALYLHPAESGVGMAEIKAVTPGQLEFTVEITGQPPSTTEPSQTAFSHLGVNPIDKALVIRDALMALAADRAKRVRHRLIETEVGRATNLHVSHITCGEIEKLGRIADTCVVGGAVSFPPHEAMDNVQVEIEKAIAVAADQDTWLSENRPVVAWRSGVAGAEVSADHALFRTAAAAVKSITGADPRVNPMHTTSDIRNPILEAGIPCVGLGCLGGDLSQNGGHDEWVSRDDFFRMVDVTTEAAANWCCGTGQ